MGIFIVWDCIGGTADDVQLAFGADVEPGVVAVMKGFRDGVETDDIAVKAGTFFEVDYVNGDVVESGHGLGLSVTELGDEETGKKE